MILQKVSWISVVTDTIENCRIDNVAVLSVLKISEKKNVKE